MLSPEELLRDAQAAPARTDLASHVKAIRTLRAKKWSWREIADFLRERGVETDHTKLLRFMLKHEQRWQVPTSADYEKALIKLKASGKLKGPQVAMLQHLYEAHNRTATYSELANAAAQAGGIVPPERPHVYANLEFGKLGKVLGETLGMEFLPSSKRDAPFYSSSIGVGSSTTPDGAEFELVMHHELAKAMDRLLVQRISGLEFVEEKS